MLVSQSSEPVATEDLQASDSLPLKDVSRAVLEGGGGSGGAPS